MTALYNEALFKWAVVAYKNGNSTPAVWKIAAPVLAQQNRNWSMRGVGRDDDSSTPTPLPDVTVGQVESAFRAGYIPHLFLEEFDKIKLDSDFQQKEFHSLIDSFQSAGGVVVAASNLNVQQLETRLGLQIGGPIIRRLIGPRLYLEKSTEPTDATRAGILSTSGLGRLPMARRQTSTPALNPTLISRST